MDNFNDMLYVFIYNDGNAVYVDIQGVVFALVNTNCSY